MNGNKNVSAVVFDGSNGKRLARIVLNDYSVTRQGPISYIMRNFQLVDGQLASAKNFLVRADSGWQAVAKLATQPTGNQTGRLQFN